MLIQTKIPKKLLTKSLATYLMSFYVIRDPKTELPIQICEMKMNNKNTEVRYYPLDGDEDFINHFGGGTKNDRIPKSIIEALMSDSVSDELLDELLTLVADIDQFMDSHENKFSTGYFDTPFTVVPNENQNK